MLRFLSLACLFLLMPVLAGCVAQPQPGQRVGYMAPHAARPADYASLYARLGPPPEEFNRAPYGGAFPCRNGINLVNTTDPNGWCGNRPGNIIRGKEPVVATPASVATPKPTPAAKPVATGRCSSCWSD